MTHPSGLPPGEAPGLLIVVFEPPPTRATGPSFACPRCSRVIRAHEWSRDYDAASPDGLEVRCGCSRRYKWQWGSPAIEVVLTHWSRAHHTGWHAHVSLEFTGDYHYGSADSASAAPRWSGTTRNLTRAQRLADESVPAHDCGCPPWTGRG